MTTTSPKRLAQKSRYNKSEKGRAATKRYKQSPKWNAVCTSESYRAYHRRYRQTPKGKGSVKRYEQSSKCKATKKRYRHTEKGKAIARIQGKRRYSRNPNPFKAVQAVKEAIVHGKLLPLCSLRCLYCDEQAEQYHHYIDHEPEHWLDVVPTCKKCHLQIRSTGRGKETYEHAQNVND